MHYWKVLIYQTKSGKEPFVQWLEKIDKHGQIKIRKRIARIELGNLGDYKSVGPGVFELRLFFGSGYRVYFGMCNHAVIILLCGGDKSSQAKDIQKAIDYWKEVENANIS